MNGQTNDSLEEIRGQITAIMVALRVADGMGTQSGVLASGTHRDLERLLPSLSPAQGAAAKAILAKHLPLPRQPWE